MTRLEALRRLKAVTEARRTAGVARLRSASAILSDHLSEQARVGDLKADRLRAIAGSESLGPDPAPWLERERARSASAAQKAAVLRGEELSLRQAAARAVGEDEIVEKLIHRARSERRRDEGR